MQNQEQIASVLSASRRELILLNYKRIISAKRAGQLRSVCVGDKVEFDQRANEYYAHTLLERKNCISRASKGIQQVVAANIDLLCIVTSATNQYNALFLDRVICVAQVEQIPYLIVVNKSDLDLGQAERIRGLYKSLGMDAICCSAKNSELAELTAHIHKKDLTNLALLGLSGVGKSTILNALIPDARRLTQSVSSKTGHGKQTTTLARGYQMSRQNLDDLIVIDLPGIQHFGLDHLLKHNLEHLFQEFLLYSSACKYRDCKHLLEEQCAVKVALESAKIPQSRYDSYQHISHELEQAKKYQYSEKK